MGYLMNLQQKYKQSFGKGWFLHSWQHALAAKGIKTRKYQSNKRKRIAPIEKLVPHLYSDELGFATEHQEDLAMKAGEGKFIVAKHFFTESNVPKELEAYARHSPDSSIEDYPVPKHSQNLLNEQRYLRRRAKELARERLGNVPKTPGEQRSAWHGRLDKAVATDKAMEHLWKESEREPILKQSPEQKFVRIISQDDRAAVLGPFKSVDDAKKAKQDFLNVVEKEQKFRKELFESSSDRPLLERNRDLGDIPYSIDIMNKSDVEGYYNDSIFKKAPKKLEKMFPHEPVYFARKFMARLEETPDEKRLRTNRGYTKLIEVDAKKLADKFEKDQGEKIAWNENRLKSAMERDVVTGAPQIFKSTGNKIDITDGRHRIAAAALKGEKIKIAVRPSFDLEEDLK